MVRDTARNSRRIRFTAASLSAVAALLFANPAATAENHNLDQGHIAPGLTFHPPLTEAEKALNSIFELRNTDAPVFEFMTDREGGRRKHHKELGRYFSGPLLDEVSALERTLVKNECGGKYVDGELCGFGYDPLRCAQDIPSDGYLFHTSALNKSTGTIAVAWEENGPLVARYRMVKRRGNWIIDAIACEGSDRFNWRE